MTHPNGWPDASRPGWPANPERDGWHWVANDVWRWHAARYPGDRGVWVIEGYCRPTEWAAGLAYKGPCLSPSEVAARVEDAVREERERCHVLVVGMSIAKMDEARKLEADRNWPGSNKLIAEANVLLAAANKMLAQCTPDQMNREAVDKAVSSEPEAPKAARKPRKAFI